MTLTIKEIDALKPKDSTYRVRDDLGLYMQVKPTGAKSWMFRYTKEDGSRAWMGLGGYPAVGAAKAREEARKLRSKVAGGIDPIKDKRDNRQAMIEARANTFASVAKAWYEFKKPRWSEATAGKCGEYLEKDILPALGPRPITTITPADTANLVATIENRKAFNVAQKVRQWLRAIFSYAIAKGLMTHNPASELVSIAAKGPMPKHYAHLLESELPEFLRALTSYQGSLLTRIAARLVLLTACRPGVVRSAEWCEFDLDQCIWQIPAAKMKMRRPHLVPLPKQAVAMLRELHLISGSYQHLFPGQGGYGKRDGSIMSEGTINQAFARVGYKGRMTGHGSRHTASTLLNEHKSKEGFDPHWIDAQLSHKEKDAPTIRGEYNHAMYIEHRRRMMQWYADYLDFLEHGSGTPELHNQAA